MKVHLRHARTLQYCTRGIRAFIARHNLDWTAFRTTGLEAEALAATGDAMALAAIDVATREAAQ